MIDSKISSNVSSMNIGTLFIALSRAFLIAQVVKRLPAMWETQVRSLGWEDPLEKEMATHSSTLAWKILKESDTTE